ncbi:tail protein X [Asticcacaulis taihuensis]|uniref:tail protein X n=1 Tax=Asticcacaulis taihuensis TaxID=260084 RepID=UPI0034E95208
MAAKTLTAAALQDEPLDALCYRVLGTTAGVVEQALELNRGLADLGEFLPEGTVVILPAKITTETPQNKIVQLWE